MTTGPLGFGWMRLPQKSDNPKDIDFEQVNQMVDEYLSSGFTYFDTSFVYHNGGSESAIKRCLVDRHARSEFVLASKLPTFTITEEEQVDSIFRQQLTNCGVEYFDYYLLHNLNQIRYENEVRRCRMFEHMQAWKREGRIRHIGFSFHDSADVLDRILTEHPEVEAVQIALNYIDWDARLVQAKACYDVIRRHGCKVIVMEPMKGGMLASVPESAERRMKALQPKLSVGSWAIRFASSLEGLLTVLSGMSDLTQIRDNISYMKDFQPLTDTERALLDDVRKEICADGPAGTTDYAPYESINPKGVSAAVILETYDHCMLQPNPAFTAEHNYFTTEKAKHGIAPDERCIPGAAILPDGTDVTELVHQAEDFLTQNAFFSYPLNEQ